MKEVSFGKEPSLRKRRPICIKTIKHLCYNESPPRYLDCVACEVWRGWKE